MRKKSFFILTILLLVVLGIAAKGGNKKKIVTSAKKPVVSQEQMAQEALMEEMLPSTAKLMVIDSMVVEKADFLKSIPFSSDMGRMIADKGIHGYINEFDDTEVVAHGDSVNRNLFLAHRYGKEWNEALKLPELKGSFQWVDWPFLMSDGVTLYFSARGEGTLGGLDLYKANYNADESKFFEPTNIGLPYNSSANDYFLAISDFYNLGFLVSDRYQPADKVCIYIFQPTQQRETFAEDVPEEKLRTYALLRSIKDTWNFGDRETALLRLSQMKDQKTATTEKIRFVVDDRHVYSAPEQFRSTDARESFLKLQETKRQYEVNNRLLYTSRKTYSELPKNKRQNTAEQITKLEEQQKKFENEIANLTKKIRIDEISCF